MFTFALMYLHFLATLVRFKGDPAPPSKSKTGGASSAVAHRGHTGGSV